MPNSLSRGVGTMKDMDLDKQQMKAVIHEIAHVKEKYDMPIGYDYMAMVMVFIFSASR